MMKKFIRNNSSAIKCVYSAVVGTAYMLSFRLAPNIPVQLSLMFLTGLLFITPYIINIEKIKHFRIGKLSAFIVRDALFVLAPAILAAAITELICVSAVGEPGPLSGMGTVMFGLIAIVLTGVFWLAYLIFNASYKE